MDALEPSRDYYLIGHDFSSYLDALDRADAAYGDQTSWAAKTISATSMWAFSSDRTIKEYADHVWGWNRCRSSRRITITRGWRPR